MPTSASPSLSPSPSSSPPQSHPQSNPNSQLQLIPLPPPSAAAEPKPILLAIQVPTQKKSQAVQWTPEETANLIQAYQEKWYSLRKGQLKAHQWEEVTATVAARCAYGEPTKTSTQCRHKMEKLRKRYRAEKRKGGRSVWPFFYMMDRMECGTQQPISARPVNMVRFPNSVPKYVDNSEEEDDEEQDEDDHARLNSRSCSINNLLRKPMMVTRFPGSAGYASSPAMPLSLVGRREGIMPSDTDEDSDDEELKESKERNVAGEKRLLLELAKEIKEFAQRIAKVEKKKMDIMRETEKQRMEMESKWTKMIMDSQSKMIDTIDNWSREGTQKKMKVRS